jgi:7-carboxy-7-deazaguanine synthase
MRICEVFYSLQGEGTEQGRPTAFVRLAGCNLACAWCDTPQAQDAAGGQDVAVDVLLDHLWRKKCRTVCFTGGEPLLQIDEVVGACRRLSGTGYAVSIETNGTVDFRPVQPFASVCMDVKCPSSGEKSDLALLSYIRENDSVKFVVGTNEDIAYVERVLKHCPIKGEIFVSPVYGADERGIARWVLESGFPIRFQIQLHKYLEMK